jgi:ribosomal protein S18 acetylase RimI-like enzyme
MNLQSVVDFLEKFPTVSFCSWSDAQLLQKMMDQRVLVGFGAIYDQNIVGVILGGCLGLRGTINHLAVEPFSRRQKIGKNLVDLMCEYFTEMGIRRIFVFSQRDSEGVIDFWVNSKFQIIHNEVTLERDLY